MSCSRPCSRVLIIIGHHGGRYTSRRKRRYHDSVRELHRRRVKMAYSLIPSALGNAHPPAEVIMMYNVWRRPPDMACIVEAERRRGAAHRPVRCPDGRRPIRRRNSRSWRRERRRLGLLRTRLPLLRSARPGLAAALASGLKRMSRGLPRVHPSHDPQIRVINRSSES